MKEGRAKKVITYDTTLRDGSQRAGARLSPQDKWRIVKRLDEFGIDYIEAGFLGSNPSDNRFFSAYKRVRQQLGHSQLVAFGLPVRKGLLVEEDPALQGLMDLAPETVTLVGKACKQQVQAAMQQDANQNLKAIYDSVSFLRQGGKRVFFDAEHYFEAYLHDTGYAFEVLAAAVEGGAECVVLADTNGGSLPSDVFAVTQKTVLALANVYPQVTVGVHAHNDSGCAVANSMEALRAGANMVQGTINGYGERVGNADLIQVIANLELKLGQEVIGRERLRRAAPLANFVADTFNTLLDPHAPFVGKAAFTHKGGLHVSAEMREKGAYQHIDPAAVGNFSHVVLSELAGRAALAAKALELGVVKAAKDNERLLALIKQREAQGYSYEAADASLALLLRAQTGEPACFFTLESFRVISERRADGSSGTEATIKILVGEERFIATAEGNGPVNALDAALRKAITRFYPQIKHLELRDFKVRVLDGSVGTGAVTRVFIDTGDDQDSWQTVGVNQNIIEASWEALVDAISYGLLKGRQDA
jgi:2-isopropylmalate synthase